jgi:hypothetical protein
LGILPDGSLSILNLPMDSGQTGAIPCLLRFGVPALGVGLFRIVAIRRNTAWDRLATKFES